jgi:hypothetical protein
LSDACITPSSVIGVTVTNLLIAMYFRDRVSPRRGLLRLLDDSRSAPDGQARGFKPGDELIHLFPHFAPRRDVARSMRCSAPAVLAKAALEDSQGAFTRNADLGGEVGAALA